MISHMVSSPYDGLSMGPKMLPHRDQGDLLGASWVSLGASWGLLGAPWGPLGAPWWGSGAILGTSWKIVN